MRDFLWINGRDVGRDFGFVVEKFPEWGAFQTINPGAEALLGRAGVMRTMGTLPPAARTFTVEGSFIGTSASDLRTKVAEFFRWVRFGELYELETALAPGRLLFVVPQDTSFALAGPQLLSRSTDKGTLQFQLFSPLFYEKTYQVYGGPSGTRIMPVLGNFPSAPEVLLSGPIGVINPSVSLYRANGSLIKTVSYTVTLATDDYLRIVNDEMLVYKVLNGVITDDPSIAPFGDPFFSFNPADGDPVNGRYPYIVGNNCTVQVLLRRLWTVPS